MAPSILFNPRQRGRASGWLDADYLGRAAFKKNPKRQRTVFERRGWHLFGMRFMMENALIEAMGVFQGVLCISQARNINNHAGFTMFCESRLRQTVNKQAPFGALFIFFYHCFYH